MARRNKADEKRAERRARKRAAAAREGESRQRAEGSGQDAPEAKQKPPRKRPASRAKAESAAIGPPSDALGSPVATDAQVLVATDAQELSAAEKHRRRAAQRSRDRYARDAELGEIPAVVDPERRARCELDFWLAVHEYFLPACYPALSPMHRQVCGNLQAAAIDGGLFAQAIFRGAMKTTLAIWATVWALLYAHRRYVVLFAYKEDDAVDLMEDIKAELLENDKLLEDFPEVLYAVHAVGGNNQRARNQLYQGEKTGGAWEKTEIVLPKCGDSKCGHGVVRVRGQGNARGLRKRMPDGSRLRPDWFIGDDCENDDSAASAVRVEKLIGRIFKSWLPMAGHAGTIAGVLNGTIAARGAMIDKATDPHDERFAGWEKYRAPMLLSRSTAHETHWLGPYREIYITTGDGRTPAQRRRRATEYYEAHRAEMDAGAEVGWVGCYTPDKQEVSAVQHAYNFLIELGEEAFATECQNEPLKTEAEEVVLPASVIVRKQSPHKPGVVGPEATHLVAMVDQQDSVLYWGVAAFGDGLSGYLVEYGAWPDQKSLYFTLATLRTTLGAYYRDSPRPEHGGPGALLEEDAAIVAGLSDLERMLFSRRYARVGGGELAVDLMGVDQANGNRTDVIRKWIHTSPNKARIIGTQGRGIRAKDAPMAQWPHHAGERRGLEWVERRAKELGTRHLLYNTNYHKLGFFRALRLPSGSVGSLALPLVTSPARHQLFADHCQATSCDLVTSDAQERSAYEFADKPGADNHFFDVGVGLRVLAMVAGVRPPGAPARKAKTTARPRGPKQARRL